MVQCSIEADVLKLSGVSAVPYIRLLCRRCSERLGCSTMVDVVTNEPISVLAGLSRWPHQSEIYTILFRQGLYRMFFAFEICLWKLAAMKISRMYKTSITVGG